MLSDPIGIGTKNIYREIILQVYRYQISDENSDNEQLASFLIRQHRYSSRLLRRIKAEGMMTINGKDCWLCSRISPGDQIEITLPEEYVDTEATDHPIDIIYEDDEVLVVNKDDHCVTHPTKRHQTDTLSNYVANYYIKSGQKRKIRFINRLDTDTSGIVVIAKNKYVHHFIQSAKDEPEHEKTYTAFVHGRFPTRSGTINAPIGRVGEDTIVRRITADGKPCVTHYEVLEQYADAALVRLRLETGRTHQIRVHMNHIGHPVIGDPMYCDEALPAYNMERQALHSTEMVLTLPTAGRKRFRADFKTDMMMLWKTLRQTADEGC